MRGRQTLFDPAEVDRWRGGRGTEVLAGDLAAECMMLQVVKTGGALDIGQRLRLGLLLPLEHLPAGDRPLELTNEFLEVVLHDPVKIHQLAIDVVDDLASSRYRA